MDATLNVVGFKIAVEEEVLDFANGATIFALPIGTLLIKKLFYFRTKTSYKGSCEFFISAV